MPAESEPTTFDGATSHIDDDKLTVPSEGFELCPADACRTRVSPAAAPKPGLFEIVSNFDRQALITRYETFLHDNHIEIAGIEFIESETGELVTYDVNTNTNYNAEAESEAGLTDAGGMRTIARFLGDELDALSEPRARYGT